jgi:hypothetical protein
MQRGARRSSKSSVARGAAEDASFSRILEAIGGGSKKRGGDRSSSPGFADALRLAARLKRLEERIGRSGVAELSPYLESLLRMARASNVVRPSTLRKAASF